MHVFISDDRAVAVNLDLRALPRAWQEDLVAAPVVTLLWVHREPTLFEGTDGARPNHLPMCVRLSNSATGVYLDALADARQPRTGHWRGVGRLFRVRCLCPECGAAQPESPFV